MTRSVIFRLIAVVLLALMVAFLVHRSDVGLLLTRCQENSGRENQKRSDPSTLAAWIEKAPEEVGLDGAPLAALRRRLRDTPSENVHSVLIVKGEALVFEEYLTGKDENWGDDLGTVRFARDTLHDLRSSTKSVVGSLIGMAIDDGAISSVDASIVDLFPKRAIPDADSKRSIRLRHMLSMSAGLEWDETITYADPHNSEIRMVVSGDPISYVLAQKPFARRGQGLQSLNRRLRRSIRQKCDVQLGIIGPLLFHQWIVPDNLLHLF